MTQNHPQSRKTTTEQNLCGKALGLKLHSVYEVVTDLWCMMSNLWCEVERSSEQ